MGVLSTVRRFTPLLELGLGVDLGGHSSIRTGDIPSISKLTGKHPNEFIYGIFTQEMA